MNPEDMSLKEMRAKLDELGISHDQWGEAGTGDKPVQPPMVGKYVEFLTSLEGLLTQQVVVADKEKVADLHATLQRMKHGGGI